MVKTSRKLMVYLLVAAVICLPLAGSAYADEHFKAPSTFNTFIDAVVLRPIGLCAIPVGFGAFLLALPFSALGGNTKTSFNQLVKEPTKYTFQRPLGDFD